MGKRGRRPTPTALLAARGNPRARKRLKTGVEPDVAREAPTLPEWLARDDEAAAKWRELVPMLLAAGILARIDANALERYCHLWSRWRRAEQVLRDEGETYEFVTEKGGNCVQARPEVSIAKGLAASLARLEAEFGLTPGARARVNAAPDKKQAPPETKPTKAPAMKIAS